MIETSRELEPIPTRPALRAFVEAARAQPITPTRLSGHEVQRAFVQQQQAVRHSRRQLVLGVSLGSIAMAAAAALALFVLPNDERAIESDTIANGEVEVEPASATQASIATERQSPLPLGLHPQSPLPPLALTLDPAIHVQSGTDAPQVLGPWTLALDMGDHAIRVEPTPGRALRIELPERALELVHGEVEITFVERSAVVRLESGIAAWIEADGTRTQIVVERIDLGHETVAATHETVAASEPSAATLARKAEEQLLAGSREQAVTTLRKLVRKYPRTPQARTALLDLARQERLAERPDRARCAYQLYLERWPHSEVQNEIDKQLAKLGEGPACKGLDPR